MSTNRYGLDANYFTGKLKLIIRDIDNYTPAEFAREMCRMAKTSESRVMKEPEFEVERGEPWTWNNTKAEASQ